MSRRVIRERGRVVGVEFCPVLLSNDVSTNMHVLRMREATDVAADIVAVETVSYCPSSVNEVFCPERIQ